MSKTGSAADATFPAEILHTALGSSRSLEKIKVRFTHRQRLQPLQPVTLDLTKKEGIGWVSPSLRPQGVRLLTRLSRILTQLVSSASFGFQPSRADIIIQTVSVLQQIRSAHNTLPLRLAPNGVVWVSQASETKWVTNKCFIVAFNLASQNKRLKRSNATPSSPPCHTHTHTTHALIHSDVVSSVSDWPSHQVIKPTTWYKPGNQRSPLQ
ncbi:hypothetical protein PoB_003031900 [Plakobranchus ocellatus]|uniref:Uncharacterized protein n=1 Tax=Plakobranchus ocellatus TaxID=259542 RepID=A0AAV4A868_9GAST|nr:hypothetical protein PoB_003031900 [Plakobranchus ocellatus]